MKFPGEVVGIRFSISHDWNGNPAIFFRIVLSDAASRQGTLADITGRVAGELFLPGAAIESPPSPAP